MLHYGVIYKNCPVKWNEALPAGNGFFGAMAYLSQNHLKLAFNHYDIYYSALSATDFSNMDHTDFLHNLTGGFTYEDYLQRIYHDRKKETIPPYQQTLGWTGEKKRDLRPAGATFPATGEITLLVSNCFHIQEETLSLNTETAQITYQTKNEQNTTVCTFQILKDVACAHTHISQTENTFQTILLAYPQSRNQENYQITFRQESPQLFSYTVTFPDREKPLSFSFLMLLSGAYAEGTEKDGAYAVSLLHQEQEWDILNLVTTSLEGEDFHERGLQRIKNILSNLTAHKTHSRLWWETFSQRSDVTLPDKFLENLWHLHLYILACCSGEGSRFSEQACGLNGLWDIKKPTLWGSMWYWDVNIQAAFWGVYTANHTELSKIFCKGYLKHIQGSECMARHFYHKKGAATDYPHTFYHSIGPWCAQFLWWQYEYTQDLEFLEREAYPVFLKLLTFIKEILKWDPKTQVYSIDPDISPEQGPITKNSVITVSCIRYFLSFTIKAYDTLKKSDGIKEDCQAILMHLPEYPTNIYENYGEILRDSELAPPGLHLRHPSLLMPIFPIGEINQENRTLLGKNTLSYAIDHTELGVFGFGWLACAAARLSLGDTALKVLYEKGLDLHLRPNGMGSEETGRWLNFCLINKPPLYHPFMMEPVGETIATVNEMLLQSYNGVIQIFPAVPKSWTQCAFSQLLAKGGFVVSAVRQNGKTVEIKIKSLYGQTAALYISPREAELIKYIPWGQIKDGVLFWDTQAGKTYTIGHAEPLPAIPPLTPLSHISHTGETIYIGKNKHSAYLQSLDRVLCDHYIGNIRIPQMIPYFFTFGWDNLPLTEEEQRYKITACAVPRSAFSSQQGFGFQQTDGLQWITQSYENHICHRFVQSNQDHTFLLELPAGRYDILVCCTGESSIRIQAAQQFSVQLHIPKDTPQACLLPVIQKEDGVFPLYFKNQSNIPWKIHAIIIRKYHCI